METLRLGFDPKKPDKVSTAGTLNANKINVPVRPNHSAWRTLANGENPQHRWTAFDTPSGTYPVEPRTQSGFRVTGTITDEKGITHKGALFSEPSAKPTAGSFHAEHHTSSALSRWERAETIKELRAAAWEIPYIDLIKKDAAIHVPAEPFTGRNAEMHQVIREAGNNGTGHTTVNGIHSPWERFLDGDKRLRKPGIKTNGVTEPKLITMDRRPLLEGPK